MKKVLVTGADGQLAQCIKDAAPGYNELSFFFAPRQVLDIANENSTSDFFQKNKFDFCINTAAYTNVDKAENEKDRAFSVNAEGVKYISQACRDTKTVLVHISTDYVFDGTKGGPYTEEDIVNPINMYGASKLKGEQYVASICNKYYIIRASWLYSQYGHNFLKSILRMAREGKPLTVTTEQTGAPTNANDLAEVILSVIDSGKEAYGIYHFSNSGETTWHGFAKEILKITEYFKTTKLVQTSHYLTFATRPKYSVLESEKIKNTFNISIIDWKESLKRVLASISL
jgi:dTDP-4-dehydrorhamnose reductase